ncbi:9263_t:CDS:2 [Entrophospora sp. SA101]|nr:9263_t:CDS:2 [Entrophospora sp. SA101]
MKQQENTDNIDTYVNSSTPSATSAGIIPSKPSFPPPTTSSSGYLLPSYRIYGFIVTIVLMFLL